MKCRIKILLPLLFLGAIAVGNGKGDLWRSKVDHKIFENLQRTGITEFVVYMMEQGDLSKVDGLMTKEEKGRFVYQKLKETAQRSQAGLIKELNELGVKYQSFWIFNGIMVQGNRELLEKIARRNDVLEIIENSKVIRMKSIKAEGHSPKPSNGKEWGITKSQADKVWDKGIKGKGAVIGGQDTGYDWDHPAIKQQYRGWNGTSADHNYNWHDAIKSGNGGNCGTNSPEPCDDHKHGTHTMGTMCGDVGTNQIGMAPEAKWIGCRNMDVGDGKLSTYVDCFEWFLAPTDLKGENANPEMAPHVINNSWGCPTSEGCNSSNFATMETVVNNLRDAGIVVVVSAGNDGSSCSTVKDPAAIFKGSFSVGATNSSDAIASFSSRGPVTVDNSNRLKPEISAPGVNVRSCVPGGGYENMQGTSMAGPHVAGLVALIVSANPKLAGQVDKIEEIIMTSAKKLSTTQSCGGTSGKIPNNVFGHGRIDALAAIEIALEYCNIKPKVVQNSDMLEVEGVANVKSYKWYFEGDVIAGATGATYKPTKSGKYKVEVVDNDDCTAMSEEIDVVISGVDQNEILTNFVIVPNPHTESFVLSFTRDRASSFTVEIYDLVGKSVYSSPEKIDGEFYKVISTADFPKGIYTLRIVDGANKWHKRIVKQ